MAVLLGGGRVEGVEGEGEGAREREYRYRYCFLQCIAYERIGKVGDKKLVSRYQIVFLNPNQLYQYAIDNLNMNEYRDPP
jgi:hypothetical protein